MSFVRGRGLSKFAVPLVAVLAASAPEAIEVAHGAAAARVLEDFLVAEGGFPKGWEAQRNLTRAREAYRVRESAQGPFLAAMNPDQRVFKRIAWVISRKGFLPG